MTVYELAKLLHAQRAWITDCDEFDRSHTSNCAWSKNEDNEIFISHNQSVESYVWEFYEQEDRVDAVIAAIFETYSNTSFRVGGTDDNKRVCTVRDFATMARYFV